MEVHADITDVLQVDAFKDAIHASLSDYNEQIEALKTEMSDATRIADALRSVAEAVTVFVLYCGMGS